MHPGRRGAALLGRPEGTVARSRWLTGAEHKALRVFSLAATAMELLGALREWHNGNHSPETEYLISLGTAGLSDYLTAT